MANGGREAHVRDAVVTLVDSLLDDFDVVELLTDLTERCVQLLDVNSAGLDLGAAVDRWPRFVPAATDAGFASVHAVPMRAAGTVLGALGLFGTHVGALNEADLLVGRNRTRIARADCCPIAFCVRRILHKVDHEDLAHAAL